MNERQRTLVASTVLILTGSCLLTLVGGLLVYGRFAAWVEAPPRATANTLAHINHLAPTQDETLTLITCGGANFAPFPNRLYVTAKRVDVER
jgi:hypothetical protein